MSNNASDENIDYIATCALIGARGDFSIAMEDARQAVKKLARWKLMSIIERDDAVQAAAQNEAVK